MVKRKGSSKKSVLGCKQVVARTSINSEGKTVLMVTHDYAAIAGKPARTIVCAKGRISDSATNETMVDFESLLEKNI